MARPQISDDTTHVVKKIHREETGSRAGSFEEALRTVVQLADQNLGNNEWYPGKYAGKAFERVLGSVDSGKTSREHHVSRLTPHRSVIDPNRQAVFKQTLKEDFTVMIPEPERTALSLQPGDLLQVIAYPAGGTNPELEEDGIDE